ncbi:hypothetical protein BVG80_08020 [Sphingobacteriales bacterium TSM_CSM]|nr:hypothetical protein BVG80_08020 [Sphingobacteriales bacterium TSM_CSM]
MALLRCIYKHYKVMIYDIFIYLVLQFFIILLVVIYYRIKNSALSDALKKQTEKLEQTSIKLNRIIEQRKFLENDRNAIQEDTSKLRKNAEQMQMQLKQATTNSEEQEARIQFLETYRTQSNELAEQLHQMQFLLNKTNNQLQVAESDKKALENQLQEISRQNESLKADYVHLSQIKRQYDQLLPKSEEMEAILQQLRTGNETLEAEKKQFGKQILEQKLTIGNLEKQVSLLDTVTKKHTETQNMLAMLQNEYNQLKQKYELLKEANKHLQVQIAEIKELNASYKKTIAVMENGKYTTSKV